MTKRVTPDEIVEMHRLYAKYGTYAEVARQMHRSANSVARYIKMKGTPPIVKHTFEEIARKP